MAVILTTEPPSFLNAFKNNYFLYLHSFTLAIWLKRVIITWRNRHFTRLLPRKRNNIICLFIFWLRSSLDEINLAVFKKWHDNIFSRNDAYLSKRAKCPDCSMQPFNHWMNSPKVAISNSQSVSIAARLQELPSFANLLRENNLNFVLCPPSSAAKNSGVHFAHAQLDIAPWNTAGSERFKRWFRRFTGSGSTRSFSTLNRWLTSSAILNNVTSYITPEV